MNRLDEQINRIKSLMLINEQCGGDWNQCEQDLEGQGYKVTSPNELSTSCDSNEMIKCVKDWADSKGITGKLTTGSEGNSTGDCYVLFKGTKTVPAGPSKFHISFYADGQVVITKKLDEKNDSKKLIYRSEWKCDAANEPKILGGKKSFKYVGIKSGSGSKYENDILKDASGNNAVPTAAQMSSWGVKNPIKYDDTLTYYLNGNNIISSGNVEANGLNSSEILRIIQH
jgi:hypothetical protein